VIGEIDPTNMGGGALIGVLALKAWDWIFNRRTQTALREAEATLIEGLTARITAVEARLAEVERMLDEERKAHQITKAELFEAKQKAGQA
jgi:Tfp pilus assembly protein PilN